MDLRKRLAGINNLNKKKKQDSAESGKRFSGILPEESLINLKLKKANDEKWPVYIRDYTNELAIPFVEIPNLKGFFTKAEEASPEISEILFLDTETTGLAGGTGTLAFLVGVGWFEGPRFISRQYFLPDFAHEISMLEYLEELGKKFKVVMTFNGASFDLPLIRTRALMNRMPDPCAQLVSWDLLVPGRRIWGRSFENCRQQTLEKGLLGRQRGSGDIDGALIPQTWFDFLQDGNPELMERVLHHNQKDLVGMAEIFIHVVEKAQIIHNYPAAQDSWVLAWSLARICEKSRQNITAGQWIDSALNQPGIELSDGFAHEKFIADSIRILKRVQSWNKVQFILTKAFENGLKDAWLHREAAILYEHRLVDYHRALGHAKLSEEGSRLKRLEKKIQSIKKGKLI